MIREKANGQVPRGILKTSGFSLVLKHLPRDPANVNAWKSMFDPILIFLRLTKVFKDTLFDRVGRAP